MPAAPNGTIAEDWRTFQFTGRSVQRLKEEITSRAGEATQYCVQAGRYGRLIPLTHELPHNTETIDIIIMMIGTTGEEFPFFIFMFSSYFW